MNRLKAQNKTHLQWVDNTKLLACALVVLGHFAQSMVRAGILPDTVAYTLCNSALYTFHVPLFFICSAYLYRRFTVLRTCRDYARHVGKKALALGVPYFTFAGANYALKLLFPAGVNMAEERGPVACGAVLSAMQLWHPGEKLRRALNLCSRDTFPIYLLHTICAAPVRSLLLHFGVQNPVVHIALGLAASFLLPMAAGRIAARVPVFNFFLYPTRYILKKQAAPCAAVGEP